MKLLFWTPTNEHCPHLWVERTWKEVVPKCKVWHEESGCLLPALEIFAEGESPPVLAPSRRKQELREAWVELVLRESNSIGQGGATCQVLFSQFEFWQTFHFQGCFCSIISCKNYERAHRSSQSTKGPHSHLRKSHTKERQIQMRPNLPVAKFLL